MAVDPAWTVDEVMRRWPETIRVFLARRMACVGCPIGPYHSLEDAAREHGVPLEVLLKEIRGEIARSVGAP